MQKRSDEAMARAVEQGLLIDTLQGSACAWAFMAANDVSQQTILRVLAEPNRRRPTDIALVKASTLPRKAEQLINSVRLSR